MNDRSRKEVAVMGQWLKDNEALFDVIKPNLTGQIIEMSKRDQQKYFLANNLNEAKRILSKLQYGKWFLKPTQ